MENQGRVVGSREEREIIPVPHIGNGSKDSLL
jgi:hypothetical protein